MPLMSITDAQLLEGWKTDDAYTQAIGSQWLSVNDALLLRVPSVIVRAEYNYVLNPSQAFFNNVQLITVEPIEFDPRFFQKLT